MPTANFTHTGGWQEWAVPKNVEIVDVIVDGAGASANPGGRVTGRINVNDQQVLKILVGEAGHQTTNRNGGAGATGGGGRGGDGNTVNGGDGGGGGSFIRRNATDGTVLCAAGGAGGDSGDNGQGGEGGAGSGENGSPGNSGTNSVGNATGGTQEQGGNGGTSSSGTIFAGHDATNGVADAGGRGGDPGGNAGHGGGGGGGGYRAGGGGQASSKTFAPGGGGGGGSNYTGSLIAATSSRGGGGLGDGHVTLTWDNPPPKNQPPASPTNVQVDGKNEANNLATKSTGAVTIEAEVNDPDGDDCQIVVWYSKTSTFDNHQSESSDPVRDKHRASVRLTGLQQDTHYYYRIWAKDSKGLLSNSYNSGNFWTNRAPKPPNIIELPDNVTVQSIDSVTFTWNAQDDDPQDPPTGFTFRYRYAATNEHPAGGFVLVEQIQTPVETWTFNPGTFKASSFWEWQVRTRDSQGRWGDFTSIRSFYVLGTSAPPIIKDPDSRHEARDATEPITFKWKFVDPAPGQHQVKADLQYRIVGQSDNQWIVLLGTNTTPGSTSRWTLPERTFAFPGYHYEWQVRTYNTSGLPSDWSDSGFFYTTGKPGSGTDNVLVADPQIKGSLGCGSYRVYLYAQGGRRMIGEITPIATGQFRRVRDDISNCLITTAGWDDDCGTLLSQARCWTHELVVFRDEERVWEGPITRITHNVGTVEFEAQDAMVYVYRRIMKQGFNDAYRLEQGEQVGLPTVVDRATQIVMNALAPHDPNVLDWLTVFRFDDDAHESRVVPDYSMTAWEQIDDMAANAGLDYTTVGRRIILWDTHRPIGRLSEMRDGDFSNPPVVTEYGMLLCNYYAVTNNSGVWGAARPPDEDEDGEFYGPIELLSSAYGESSGSNRVLTPNARDKLEETLRDQAKRNITGRWPTPLVVRVPDNSNLSPDANVGFSQLVPGVWIPVRATGTLRPIAQWQKLDSVTVNFSPGVEAISVVMSPAPNHGQDPDAIVDDTGTVTG